MALEVVEHLRAEIERMNLEWMTWKGNCDNWQKSQKRQRTDTQR